MDFVAEVFRQLLEIYIIVVFYQRHSVMVRFWHAQLYA